MITLANIAEYVEYNRFSCAAPNDRALAIYRRAVVQKIIRRGERIRVLCDLDEALNADDLAQCIQRITTPSADPSVRFEFTTLVQYLSSGHQIAESDRNVEKYLNDGWRIQRIETLFEAEDNPVNHLRYITLTRGCHVLGGGGGGDYAPVGDEDQPSIGGDQQVCPACGAIMSESGCDACAAYTLELMGVIVDPRIGGGETCQYCGSANTFYQGIDDGGGDYGDSVCETYHCEDCGNDFEICFGGLNVVEALPPDEDTSEDYPDDPRIGFDDIPFDHGYGGGGGADESCPADLSAFLDFWRIEDETRAFHMWLIDLNSADWLRFALHAAARCAGGGAFDPAEYSAGGGGGGDDFAFPNTWDESRDRFDELLACPHCGYIPTTQDPDDFCGESGLLCPECGKCVEKEEWVKVGGGGAGTTSADVYPCPKCGEPSHFGEDGFYHCACGETFGFLPFSMDSEIAQTGIYAPLSDEIDTPIYGMPPIFHDECPNCYAGGYDASKGCLFCNHGGYYSAGGGGGVPESSGAKLSSEQGCMLVFSAGLIAAAVFVYAFFIFFLPLAHYAEKEFWAWTYFILAELAALGGLNAWSQLKRIKVKGGGGGGDYAPTDNDQPSMGGERFALVRRAAKALGYSGFLVFGLALMIAFAGYTFSWVFEGELALNTLSPFVAGFANTIIGRAAVAVWLLGALWMFFDPLFEDEPSGGGGGGDYAQPLYNSDTKTLIACEACYGEGETGSYDRDVCTHCHGSGGESFGVGWAKCPRCGNVQNVEHSDYFRAGDGFMDGMVWCHACYVWSYTQRRYKVFWTLEDAPTAGGGGGGDYAPRSIIYRPGTPQQYRITQSDAGIVVEYGAFGANDSADHTIILRACFTAEDHPSAARVFESAEINFPAIDRLIFHMHFPQFRTMQNTGSHVPKWDSFHYRIGADDRGVLIVQIARGAVARIEKSKYFPVCEYPAAARAFDGDSVNSRVIDYLIFRWKKELKDAAAAAKPTGGGGGGVYAPTYTITEALARLTAADDALYAAESSGGMTTFQRIKLESDLRIAMTFYRQALGLGVVR